MAALCVVLNRGPSVCDVSMVRCDDTHDQILLSGRSWNWLMKDSTAQVIAFAGMMIALSVCSRAVAQSEPPQDATAQRLSALEAEVFELRRAAAARINQASLVSVPSGEAGLAGYCPLCPSDGIEAPPSQFPTTRVTGFFQADSGWIHQAAANRTAVGDVQDGADFRRARLAATGDVADNTGYMVELTSVFPVAPASWMSGWNYERRRC